MSWQNKENKTGIFFSFGEIQSPQMTPLRLSMTVCMDSDLKKNHPTWEPGCVYYHAVSLLLSSSLSESHFQDDFISRTTESSS